MDHKLFNVRIKNKKLGKITIFFSKHSYRRCIERNKNMLEVVANITVALDKICSPINQNKRITLVSSLWEDMTVIFTYNKFDQNKYFFNIITVYELDIVKKNDYTIFLSEA